MQKKNRTLQLITIVTFAFIFIPLVMIVVTAFGEESTIRFPIKGFTLNWFSKILANRSIMKSMGTSVSLAFGATSLALLVGIPATYALSKGQGKINNLLKSFFLSPTLIPGMVVGYTFFLFIIIKLNMPVTLALVLGHFIIVLPYIIRVVGSALNEFDGSIEEAAWSLGCTKIQAFFQVVLPNIVSGILAAFLLAFINSFNNIPVSMFLVGPGVKTLPIDLMNYIEYTYDPGISAISFLIMGVTIILMLIIDKTIGMNKIA